MEVVRAVCHEVAVELEADAAHLQLVFVEGLLVVEVEGDFGVGVIEWEGYDVYHRGGTCRI